MAKNETVKKKKKKKRGRKKSLRSLYILVTLMLSAMLVFIIILIGSSVNGQKQTALAEVNKTPTPTFTSFLTPSPTPVETQTFTPSPVPTYTPVPTPSPTSTPTPTPVPTPTPEPTPVPTAVKLNHIYEIEVDKSKQVVTVFTVGETGYYDLIVKQFICSTGHCDKISNGWYKMGTKYNWKKMENGSYARYASRISGPYLFHSCCYYSENGGKLKTHYYTNLGKNASSGCIRLTAGDAYWIYKNCPEGTPIHVITSGAKDKELIEALKPPKLKGSWDPTDPDPKNPYYVEPVTTPIPTPALGVTPAPTPSWTVHPQLKAWGYC